MHVPSFFWWKLYFPFLDLEFDLLPLKMVVKNQNNSLPEMDYSKSHEATTSFDFIVELCHLAGMINLDQVE